MGRLRRTKITSCLSLLYFYSTTGGLACLSNGGVSYLTYLIVVCTGLVGFGSGGWLLALWLHLISYLFSHSFSYSFYALPWVISGASLCWLALCGLVVGRGS